MTRTAAFYFVVLSLIAVLAWSQRRQLASTPNRTTAGSLVTAPVEAPVRTVTWPELLSGENEPRGRALVIEPVTEGQDSRIRRQGSDVRLPDRVSPVSGDEARLTGSKRGQ